MKSSPLRKLAAACIVAFGFSVVAVMVVLSVGSKNVTGSDFVEYWAAEQQIVHGGNPYDPVTTLKMEQAAGRDLDKTEVTYSPPVGLVLALPLGYVQSTTGYILWSLALFASFALAVWILWLQHGAPNTLLHLLCFLFAPAVVCVLAGQLGIFFLLGVALFLYLHRSWPLLAGAALLPCSLKPHLFVPVAVVLVLWTLSTKAYRVLGGFLLAAAASSAVMWRMDPQIWTQYLQMVRSQSVMSAVSPTLSAMLRLLVSPRSAWLQFVPEMGACVWAVWYFRRRRAEWDWTDHGLLVLLVSVLCTPYGYFTDDSVLLPAVLTGLYGARSTGRSLLPLFVLGGIGLVEMGQKVKLTTPYYLWSAPAWLAWYLYATRDRVALAEETAGAASLVD
ncbi:MAG: glycosyltransferase family 87 protein [Terriglobia bacterium]|nr:glycosyltransferase family 87 protein [Terriglobia bacterium]